jgi:hypothetical protein
VKVLRDSFLFVKSLLTVEGFGHSFPCREIMSNLAYIGQCYWSCHLIMWHDDHMN